jgi:hypothetical protein
MVYKHQVRIFALEVPRQAEFDLSTYPMGGRASSRAGFNSATNPPDPIDCRGLSVSVGIADREDAILPAISAVLRRGSFPTLRPRTSFECPLPDAG